MKQQEPAKTGYIQLTTVGVKAISHDLLSKRTSDLFVTSELKDVIS